MKKLQILPKKDSPEVVFDPQSGNFSIVGISHPENISNFFDPVMKWLDEYLIEINKSSSANIKPIKLRLFFKYIPTFNHASSFDLVRLLTVPLALQSLAHKPKTRVVIVQAL